MQLNLTRPLAFFDLETTGVNVASDRIVEISIIKIMPDGTEQVLDQRLNPQMKIPEGASAVHGIFNDDVAECPTFLDFGREIATFLADSDLAGFNSNKFDVPMLFEEFTRVGIEFNIDNRKLVDVQNIFHKMEQRTLVAAYKFYCGKALENAHNALADTRATYEVLLAQIQKYENYVEVDKNGVESKPIQNDVNALFKFSYINKNVDFAGRMIFDDNKKEVFNFGKYKGQIVEDILKKDTSYYDWMMKGDFPQNTKKKLTEIRLRAMSTKG